MTQPGAPPRQHRRLPSCEGEAQPAVAHYLDVCCPSDTSSTSSPAIARPPPLVRPVLDLSPHTPVTASHDGPSPSLQFAVRANEIQGSKTHLTANPLLVVPPRYMATMFRRLVASEHVDWVVMDSNFRVGDIPSPHCCRLAGKSQGSCRCGHCSG